MSLSEAAERLDGAFADADAKINSLNAKIDATFNSVTELGPRTFR